MDFVGVLVPVCDVGYKTIILLRSFFRSLFQPPGRYQRRFWEPPPSVIRCFERFSGVLTDVLLIGGFVIAFLCMWLYFFT